MRIVNVAMVAALTIGSWTASAHAAYIINVVQSGSDVVATGSGSVDLTGFSLSDSSSENPFIAPASNALKLGPPAEGEDNNQDLYTGTISGPGSFGSGSLTPADDATGPSFGFTPSVGGILVVPFGYSSGDLLPASTAIFSNATFASLGLTPGSYVYTLQGGGGAALPALAAFDKIQNLDTITLNIGVSAVPLPAAAPMFGTALIVLGAVGYGMKRKASA